MAIGKRGERLYSALLDLVGRPILAAAGFSAGAGGGVGVAQAATKGGCGQNWPPHIEQSN